MKIFLILLLTLLEQSILFTQVDSSWTRRFNGTFNSDDFVTEMVIDKKGSVYVTGSSFDIDGEKITTIKYLPSGEISWVAKFHPDNYGNRRAYGIAVDDSLNVYVTGFSSSLSNPSTFVTIKYDSTGQQQWFKYFGPFMGEARAITLDDQWNVYVTGFCTMDVLGFDFVTIKYNNCGDLLWYARYTNSVNGNDFPNSIAVDDYGSVYVTGTSYDSTTHFDILTVKYDSSGLQQWVRRLDDPGLTGSRDDGANAIRIDKNGNVVVTGGVQGTGSLGLPPESYKDCITIKYNNDGDTLWIKKYDTGWGNDLLIDSLTNIYVTGCGYPNTSPDYLTLKYNQSGQLIWNKYYNGPLYASSDYAKSITVDNVGNVYVTGKSTGTFIYDDYATVKYNPNGEELWAARYDGPTNSVDKAIAVCVDDNFNVYITGQSKGQNTYTDFLTIKYVQEISVTAIITSNTLAGSQVIEVNSTNGFAIGDSIVINPGGSNEELNKIVGFSSIQLQTPLQFDHFVGEQVVKLNITSVEEQNENLLAKFELYQNYPNPFNPTTKISWQSPVGSHQTIKVFDVLGNEIATLIDEYKSAGKFEVEFDGSRLASGIYFYQLRAGDFLETKKMLYLK